jgi:hypothetical protein
MRRVVASTTAIAAAVAIIAMMVPAWAAETTIWAYYRDKFPEQQYTGNDGTYHFSTSWTEVGEANGPTKGQVTVSGHGYCYGYCVQIGGGEPAVGNVGIQRSANLTGALEVKVTFIYATDLFGGALDQEVALQVSKDGVNFTTLNTYPIDADEDMVRQDYITVTSFAGPQTTFRFVSVGGAPDNVFLFDEFLVKAKFVDDAPEATTTTTTTTTLPPTTTTTTTTTLPPTTTTTTTTLPPTTTTTAPQDPSGTATTTLPPSDGATPTTAAPDSSTTSTSIATLGVTGGPPPGSDESFRTKDALVVRDVARPEVPGTRSSTGGRDPVSLVVSFTTKAEVFTGGALPSTILGVLIAVLAVIGLSRGMKPDTR